MKKIILDLCGGTGAWSKPYAEAGYDVRIVTTPYHDVRSYHPPYPVHGVLAAPPCTVFSTVNQRKRTDREMLDGLIIVANCLRIIAQCEPKWWALENVIGRLSSFMGKPVMIFQPWQYGDPWTKRTGLWGKFNPLVKRPVPPKYAAVSSGRILTGERRQERRTKRSALTRAITPPGFASAFFNANP